MLYSVLLALFLPIAGIAVIFLVYLCMVAYAVTNQSRNAEHDEPVKPKGLSADQLDKLPKITGKELVIGNECAVCLEEVEAEQPARLVPGCNHGFHLQCADAWLSKHSICPVCRTNLDPELFNPC